MSVAVKAEVGDIRDLAEQTGTGDIYDRVQQIARAAVDAVIDTRGLTMETLPEGAPERTTLVAATPQGKLPLAINEVAHRQLAEAVGIPQQYYDRMKQGQPDLLATNVNRWLQVQPERRMLRMLKPVTEVDRARLGTLHTPMAIRAIVSPKFKPVDNVGLLDAILPVAAQEGLILQSAEITERKFFLRLKTRESTTVEAIRQRYADQYGVTVQQVARHHMVNGKDISWVNEQLSFGINISNSEVGFGAVLVEGLAEILSCLNALIAQARRRSIHVGKAKVEGYQSPETQLLEAAAVHAGARDAVIELMRAETKVRVAKAIEQGVQPLALPAELPLFEWVNLATEQFDLSEKEMEIVREEVVKDAVARQRQAGTLFGVSQGLTAAAKRMESFERRDDLEHFGWEVLESDTTKLIEAAGKLVDRKN